MHGLGNDFMVINGIDHPVKLDPNMIRRWADRHTGIGFDQLLLIESSFDRDCDFRYRIFNADGEEVGQCGNGARCCAAYVYAKKMTINKVIRVQTRDRKLTLHIKDHNLVEVNMGKAKLVPEEIPFTPPNPSPATNGLYLIRINQLPFEVAVANLGNPHAIVLVKDVDQTPIAKWGALIESASSYFPQRTNVGFMQILDQAHIRLRVFERGVGETLACGSGACAAVVVGYKLGLLAKKVWVTLPGGSLFVYIMSSGEILLTGPANFVFEGSVIL